MKGDVKPIHEFRRVRGDLPDAPRDREDVHHRAGSLRVVQEIRFPEPWTLAPKRIRHEFTIGEKRRDDARTALETNKSPRVVLNESTRGERTLGREGREISETGFVEVLGMNDDRAADVPTHFKGMPKYLLARFGKFCTDRKVRSSYLAECNCLLCRNPPACQVERRELDVDGRTDSKLRTQRNEVYRVGSEDHVHPNPRLLPDPMGESARLAKLLLVFLDRGRRFRAIRLGIEKEMGSPSGSKASGRAHAFAGRRQVAVMIDDRQISRKQQRRRPKSF